MREREATLPPAPGFQAEAEARATEHWRTQGLPAALWWSELPTYFAVLAFPQVLEREGLWEGMETQKCSFLQRWLGLGCVPWPSQGAADVTAEAPSTPVPAARHFQSRRQSSGVVALNHLEDLEHRGQARALPLPARTIAEVMSAPHLAATTSSKAWDTQHRAEAAGRARWARSSSGSPGLALDTLMRASMECLGGTGPSSETALTQAGRPTPNQPLPR